MSTSMRSLGMAAMSRSAPVLATLPLDAPDGVLAAVHSVEV